MKCKFCQAELEEGVTLCPACGQENLPEETAKKKMTSTKLAVIYICIIVLLAALIAPVIMGLKNGGSADKDAQWVKDFVDAFTSQTQIEKINEKNVPNLAWKILFEASDAQ